MKETCSQPERIQEYASREEREARQSIQALYKSNPLPQGEQLSNLGLFLKRQDLSRILFMDDLYRKIVDIHGVIMEFGVRWGQNLALFTALRGLYEPFNHNRKVIGFDTFEGFPEVDEKDGAADIVEPGAYGVTDGYRSYLEKILEYHESECPIPHIKKHELVQGDACLEIERYLERNPETIVAFAYFDFDLYKPTKRCLEAILPHTTRGTVLGFDEVNVHDFPGETRALQEVLGLNRYSIRRSRYSSVQSYIVLEG